mgnify:CR=1 FL=1
MTLLTEDALKLVLALIVGGVVGAEREYRDRAAGLRTIILICLGATLLTMLSFRLAGPRGDTGRVAANIVTGIGFLGAGAILRSHGRIVGLTTASAIWMAAALGMGIGAGQYLVVLVSVALVLIVLLMFPRVEALMGRLSHTRRYEVICEPSAEKCTELKALFEENGLRIVRHSRRRAGDDLICRWEASGLPAAHERLVDQLVVHPDVRAFRG